MKIQYQHRHQSFHTFISTNNTYPLHLHKHVEITIVLSGKIHITIDQQEYILSEGDMVVIFPNQPHSYKTTESSRIQLVFFDAAFPGDFTGDLTRHIPNNPMIPKEHLIDNVSNMLKALHEQYKGNCDNRLLRAYTSVVLGHVLPLLSLKKIEYTQDLDSIQRILAYVDLHFLEPVTLDMLAREVGVSKFLISRIFSEQLHTSFRDYVNGRRLALAQVLLLSTSNPVTEIAFDSGFNSLRSFYRAFKKEYGITPNEFRSNAQEVV
ncbi:AraC family transcriptional regulator [Paenibacillus sp. sptzw28]|uniref:AraC family transcriptional regulator n=1 Tax=Paenibacillus sp. sptzw28 TaxID=715179 RepID=UPI001C6E3639|nr:AraC family transcriptional regulator [Paenibacillus sp. sptzw28]QYR21099.1 AraC family transcriptional regulator [Paenibacillus sp. sptzw28]